MFRAAFPQTPFQHFPKRTLNSDICPTGARSLACFTLVGASHQLRRFIALQPKDEREGRSIWECTCSCPSSGIDRALGLLLSIALPSRSIHRILCCRRLKSSLFALQFFIDLPVRFNQRDAAVQNMSCLDSAEPLAVTVSHAVKLSQIAIDRFNTMVGLASDLIGTLAVNIPFATNNLFVRHTTAGIVNRPAPGDDRVVLTFVCRRSGQRRTCRG